MGIVAVVFQSLNCVQLFETPLDYSTLGSSALHYLLEFAQIHLHCVRDAI